MANKISKFVFLILFFLLQSCSGGRIGNFLESSFENNNTNKISQKDINKELKNDLISKDEQLLKKQDNTSNIKIGDENKSQNISNSFSMDANDAITKKKKRQIYNPKSYRVFVILKKVDPSFPTENFSKVLRNGDVNFEIEKIELIPELKQNKK